MMLVLLDQRANLDHDFFDAEVGEAHIEVKAALKFANDARSVNSPRYISLAERTNSTIIIVGVKCFGLLFYG